MPGLRALVAAAVVGVGVGAYVNVWFGWPMFVSIGLGALLALLVLLVAAAVDPDPGEADAAWRLAAPDLVRRRLGPGDATPGPTAGADGVDDGEHVDDAEAAGR